MSAGRILVVDDDPQIRRVMRVTLTGQGYEVDDAKSGDAALEKLRDARFDLVLLDMNLPGTSGLEVCHAIRSQSEIAIIMLTVRDSEEDKVAALDAGADDYLTKPFGMNELLARMRFAQRHADAVVTSTEPQSFEFGELRIDLQRREVTRAGEPIALTSTEYKLLVLLAQHAGRVLTHRQILQRVWGPAYATQSHYVRVEMAELRKKIERDPSRPKLLTTEAGVGYRLNDRE
jgi:two-component system KDP operon response regulator KdpE